MKADITHEDLYVLLKAFFKEKGLVKQHIDSYNEFIKSGLQQIIDEVGELEVETPSGPYKIKFGKVKFAYPEAMRYEIEGPYVTEKIDEVKHEILPAEARLRNLTYAAPISLLMTPIIDGRREESKQVFIGNMPVMLRSNICALSRMSFKELVANGEDPNDFGGYFIVNGSERVIVALEEIAPNRALIDIDERGATRIYKAKVFSTSINFKARVEIVMRSDNVLYVIMPGTPEEIPFVILMRALGMKTDKEIADAVSLDEEIRKELEPSFEKAAEVETMEDAILYIGSRIAYDQVKEFRIEKAEGTLDKNLLPHIGRTLKERKEKALFLAEMACKVIELKLGRRTPDDKDHLKNKRLRLAGSLLADLFRSAFKNLCRDLKYQLKRAGVKRYVADYLPIAVRPSIITEQLQNSLATGNWGKGHIGITQLLDRTNYISALSHLRRSQSPLSRSQPNFEARDLHSTHWGRFCSNETPEGANCGLVKNLALYAYVSVAVDSEDVKKKLYKMGVVPIALADDELRLNGAKVFVDGRLIGYTASPNELVVEFRERRRRGEISSEVNIAYYSKAYGRVEEICVNCDEGRILRPLIVVKNGKPMLKREHVEKVRSEGWKWSDLVKNGIVEYLDAEEEENAYIALKFDEITPQHTHVEIAPYAILGVCASLIPYAEHNQSPRNSYEAAMAKQALGVYVANFTERVDSRSHILHYPQAPLVKAKSMEVIKYDKRPAGQNCIVAVLSYEGYNMEDALIFNKASIERGLGCSTFYRLYEAECSRYPGGQRDKFAIPEPGLSGYRGENYYRLLEPDGAVYPEARVSGGDVLIGRISPPRFLEEYKEFEVKGPSMRDTSIDVRPAESGIVDGVYLTQTSEGHKLIKVRVRDQRIPELGDKFASMHGQKGVIGIIVPQEDMPFTEEGMVPDVILNPHAIPSRMTIGQFIESMAGKVAAVRGRPVDGTPFVNEGADELKRALIDLGFSHTGKEVMYDGVTGEKFIVDVFIGIAYYQKLHHMVADKIHARARGQVQMLTRQPTEGRARGGGLRFGEMERDCLIGHGASMLLRDRLLEESDKYVFYVCENCGFIAYYDIRQRKYVCRICDEKTRASPVVSPYAFKLLLQELMSICTLPQLKLKEEM